MQKEKYRKETEENKMKTVGIVTYFKSYNYGVWLQAYATERFFEKEGFDAYIINYANRLENHLTRWKSDHESVYPCFFEIGKNDDRLPNKGQLYCFYPSVVYFPPAAEYSRTTKDLFFFDCFLVLLSFPYYL